MKSENSRNYDIDYDIYRDIVIANNICNIITFLN